MMKFKCKRCGELVRLSEHEEDLINEGYLDISLLDFCDVCVEESNIIPEPDEFSDADPGL